ncbi:5-beta-cholestane-3-alpha,7-alpha-diol 12-alpha-hydroxylase [Colletotrichum sp. SAR 10_66]|nr:5-beta-cholestane-3-alpha,7-alpha-diol 12-alpha-hydroxylase [Colletotrichum sp. SAR 10_66]
MASVAPGGTGLPIIAQNSTTFGGFLPPVESNKALTIVAISFIFLLLPYAFPNTPFRPHISSGKKPAKGSSLIPLTWSHLRGVFDVLKFLTVSDLFHRASPLQIKWFNFSCYIVQGASNIRSTFQNKSLSTFFFQGIFVHRVFLLPKKDLGLFWTEEEEAKEDGPSKHGEDEVRNDFGARSHHHISNLLSGPGTKGFNDRFDEALAKNMRNLAAGNTEHELHDLKESLDMEIVRSFIDTLCGPYLLKENPMFLEDWQYVHDNITLLFLRLPNFLMSRIYQARDRCLRAVQEWNEWAVANFHPNTISEDGFDPYWGHAFFRDRTAMYIDVDRFPFSSIAAHNLGLLWGGTANSSPAAFWAILEICRDPELMRVVKEEVVDCRIADIDGGPRFDMEKLLKKPFLQAVFAETLRLRVHGIIPRKTPVDGVNVRGSLVPGHRLFFVNSTTEHMNPAVWCTGAARTHPPEEFWPGRFLLPEKTSSGEFVYSINGKSGSWLPFGGGAHMCPGRFLAKRILIGCVAHFITLYDCEITSDKAMRGETGMSLRTFGLGTLHPSGHVGARLKTRNTSST